MSERSPFAEALRGAIRDSGLSLNELVHRLGGRGVSVTAATLSQWQNGNSQPSRRSSLPVLTELEHVLGRATGDLLRHTPLARPTPPEPDLHPPDSPLRRWAAEVREEWDLPHEAAFTRELVLARVTIDRRVWRTYGYEHQLRSALHGADRQLLVLRRQSFSADLPVPELIAMAGCEIGRFASVEIDGSEVRAVEVVLPRPLARGESWRFTVQSAQPEESASHRHLVHAAPGVGLTIGQVVFAEETPAQVRRTFGTVVAGQIEEDEPGPWESLPGRSFTGVLAGEVGRTVALDWRW